MRAFLVPPPLISFNPDFAALRTIGKAGLVFASKIGR